MNEWLHPEVAVVLMLIGVVPSLANVYLLYPDRRKPGVLWFLVLMAIGGAWAFLFASFTYASSPTVTLALANFFWPIIPAAAVAMFLLSYEYVFKETIKTRYAVGLFAPVGLLFVLTWIDPGTLVFTDEYRVDADGILHFPQPGGVLKVLIMQIYGYLLVFMAAGLFVGEAIRTTGVRRLQTLSLVAIFSVLVASTLIKVAGLVPIYYDPTSTLVGFSGLLFAYSISRHGLLKSVPMTRDKTFEEANDAVLVVNSDGKVIDVNQRSHDLFGATLLGENAADVLPAELSAVSADDTRSVELDIDGSNRYFSVHASQVDYGRGENGRILMLTDVSELKEREIELNLLKEIFSRVFRHNIRNDLTVINGYAGIIKDRSDERTIELANGIHEMSDQLLAQADKARLIEEVITNEIIVSGSLRAVVEEAIDGSAYADDSTVEIQTTVDDVAVEFNPDFHLAIRELIENAVTHDDTDGVTNIEIHSRTKAEDTTLVIEDNGSGIADEEIAVLQAGEETDLQHGSGIGLWLVRWIVTRSNGDFTATSGADGTRVEIRLPNAERRHNG